MISEYPKMDRALIFVLLWLQTTRHLLPRNMTRFGVRYLLDLFLFFFSVLLCILLYLYLVRVAPNETTPLFREIYENGFIGLFMTDLLRSEFKQLEAWSNNGLSSKH